MPINQREEKLIVAAHHGNVACFEELYTLYYEKIYALALSILKNSADAEDALQMTFINAWKNLSRLDNPSAFSTWLQRIAVNQCNSMLRNRRPAASMDDEGEDGEVMQLESDLMLPHQYAERDDLSLRLQKIINDLSDVQRETVMLFYFNDMTIEEIAVIMDCSEGTVKSRLYLARKALKTEIEEQERKTGEKFYGVALIPFGSIFVSQVMRGMISKSAAMDVFRRISTSLFGAPVTPQPTPAQGGQSVRPASGRISSAPRHVASSAAKHGTRHAASSATKASFPLWVKITSGIVAVAVIATGGIVAYNNLLPKFENIQEEAVETEMTTATEVSPSYAVGENIVFGKYEQDNDLSNGAEDISWRILDNTDGKIFVVSEYALDSFAYDDYAPGENWSDTSLRNYLNDDLYHSSFSDEEQRYIAETYLLCDEGHEREKPTTIVMDKAGTSPPKKIDTESADKVFLMNDFEVSRYFSSNNEAFATATDYAIAKGVDVDERKHSDWWLRSRSTDNSICIVGKSGNIDVNTGGASGDVFALRPAMWIDIYAMDHKQDAGSVVQPVDTRYLTQSLDSFLTSFNYRNFRKEENEFDSEKLEQTNILYDILTWFPCVNYTTYYEDLYQAKWNIVSQNPCPVSQINKSDNAAYVALNAAEIDEIAKKIFQCSDDDIERMRNSFPDSEFQTCAYSDGIYYANRTPSEFIFDPCCHNLIDADYRDGYYYFTLDIYQNTQHKRVVVNVGETPPDKRLYVKAKILPHEGKPWWSLYYYSANPSSDW